MLSREREIELFLAYKNEQCLASRNELIESMVPHVRQVAWIMRRPGVEPAELASEGVLGLVHALGKFDETRGVRLVTYAMWWVKHFMRDHLERARCVVYSPRGALRIGGKGGFMAAYCAAKARHGQDIAAIVDALQTRFGVSCDAIMRTISLAEAHNYNFNEDYLDGIDAPENVEADMQKRKSAVNAAMSCLTARERRIAELRLMRDEEDTPTLQTIAEEYGITRERVRQIEAIAKGKLATMLAEVRDEA